MNTIKRDVYVLKNKIKIPIEVTQGTDMLELEFTVRDFDIPVTAAAVAYAYKGSMKKPNSMLCEVSNNVITFSPDRNFFAVGNNELQIRVIDGDKALISFKEKVKCTGAIPFLDEEEQNEHQSLVEQLVSYSGSETAERKAADEKEATERKKEIEVERKRIDNLAKLPSGSTSGDAELVDIRVDRNGKTHPNAGEAVRQQINEIDQKYGEETSQLKQDIVNIASCNVTLQNEWLQGVINLNQKHTENNKRRYSFPKYVIPGVIYKVSISSAYMYCVLDFDNQTNSGWLQNNEFVFESTNVAILLQCQSKGTYFNISSVTIDRDVIDFSIVSNNTPGLEKKFNIEFGTLNRVGIESDTNTRARSNCIFLDRGCKYSVELFDGMEYAIVEIMNESVSGWKKDDTIEGNGYCRLIFRNCDNTVIDISKINTNLISCSDYIKQTDVENKYINKNQFEDNLLDQLDDFGISKNGNAYKETCGKFYSIGDVSQFGNSILCHFKTLEKILCYPIGTLTEGSFVKFNVEYTNPLNQSMKVCFKNSEGEILHTMSNSGFQMFVDNYDTKTWCDDSIEIKKEEKITYLKIGEYVTKFLDVDSFHLEVSTTVIGDDVWIRNYITDGIHIQKIINGQFYWNIATCLNGSILAVAYYNNNYELVVETYDIVNCAWNSAVLSECVQSTHDVHCYIDLNFDARGGLHIFANCHATPVFYFYSHDYTLQSIENRTSVFSHDVNKATYPFIVRNKNELYYIVRSGVSGNSIDLSYKYNQDTEAWTKTKAVPTADGTNGKGGTAYFGKWVTMSDGYSYNSFCWRRTQDMTTNKDILVIKTKDFEHFYSVDGKEMELPITNLNDGNAVVTRTDENSGIVNQWYTTMHEFNGHPIVVWMQYDNDGYSNIFFAYYEKNWIINKVSDFKWKWRFSKVAGTDMTFLNYDVEIINGFLKINVCSKFFDGCAYIYDDHCNFVEKIGYNGYSYGEDRNRAYLTKRFNGIKAIAITERGRGNHHYAAMTKGRLIIT